MAGLTPGLAGMTKPMANPRVPYRFSSERPGLAVELPRRVPCET